MVCVYPGHLQLVSTVYHVLFLGFEALWFNKAPGTQPIVTGTAKIIDTNITAAGTIKLQKEGAVWTARQHASAFTEHGVLFRQTAFIAFAWKNGHVPLFDKLCIY